MLGTEREKRRRETYGVETVGVSVEDHVDSTAAGGGDGAVGETEVKADYRAHAKRLCLGGAGLRLDGRRRRREGKEGGD